MSLNERTSPSDSVVQKKHCCALCEFSSDSARGIATHSRQKHDQKREGKDAPKGSRKAPKRSNDEELAFKEEEAPGVCAIGSKVCVRLPKHMKDFQCCHMNETVQKSSPNLSK